MRRRVLQGCCVTALVGLFVVAAGAWQPARTEAPTTIYLVRHAEKQDEDRDADLSDAGRERAHVLAWMLRDVPISAVYATEYKRTRHTVDAVATARTLSIETYAPNAPDLQAMLLKRHAGQTILVCGHSNTVPDMLRSLGVAFEAKLLEGYDDLFIVTIPTAGSDAQASMQHLHYPGRR